MSKKAQRAAGPASWLAHKRQQEVSSDTTGEPSPEGDPGEAPPSPGGAHDRKRPRLAPADEHSRLEAAVGPPAPPQPQPPPPPSRPSRAPLSAAAPAAAAPAKQQAAQLSAGPRGEPARANICAACAKPIRERYLLMALDKHWHEDCLKCAGCDCRLGEVGSSLFTYSDKLFCRRDFLRILGQKGHCAACKGDIPPYELVMRANELAFHMDCFACHQCQSRFCVGDRYHLTDAHKIVCLRCQPAAAVAAAAAASAAPDTPAHHSTPAGAQATSTAAADTPASGERPAPSEGQPTQPQQRPEPANGAPPTSGLGRVTPLAAPPASSQQVVTPPPPPLGDLPANGGAPSQDLVELGPSSAPAGAATPSQQASPPSVSKKRALASPAAPRSLAGQEQACVM